MKKITLLITLLVLVFSLSACTRKPFTPPTGATFTDSQAIQFYIDNNTDDPELYWAYFFEDSYYFFEGPYFNNINFTAINNYKDISGELHQFLDSFIYKYETRFVGDYPSKIELSLGATESDYNTVKLEVDEVIDVDSILITDNGLMVIFLYSEFEYEDEMIIVPSSMFAFYHSVKEITEIIENDEEKTIFFDEHIVPVMPKSHVYDQFDGFDYNKLSSDKAVFDLDYDISNLSEASLCVMSLCPDNIPLIGEIDPVFSLEDVKAFYINYFNGLEFEDRIVISNNNQTYMVELYEENETLKFKISLY